MCFQSMHARTRSLPWYTLIIQRNVTRRSQHQHSRHPAPSECCSRRPQPVACQAPTPSHAPATPLGGGGDSTTQHTRQAPSITPSPTHTKSQHTRHRHPNMPQAHAPPHPQPLSVHTPHQAAHTSHVKWNTKEHTRPKSNRTQKSTRVQSRMKHELAHTSKSSSLKSRLVEGRQGHT